MAYPSIKAAGDQVTATDFGDYTFNPVYTYGETIAAGLAVYLKASDSKIYKADANEPDHIRNLVGITITAGVLNDTNRILAPGRVVTGLSGLTAGAPVYLSDTAGALSTTKGTLTCILGIAITTTTMFFFPNILRHEAEIWGDGSDGDLTVSSNTTLNPTYKIFQYNNLTIQSTFTLDFGANFQNKFVIIKVRGNCTIAGTLSAKGLGGAGGAGGTASPGGSPSAGGGGTAGTAGLNRFDNNVGNGGGGGSDGGFVDGKGGGGGGGGAYVGTSTAGAAGTGNNGSSSGGAAATGRSTVYAIAQSQLRGGFWMGCGNGGGGGGGGSGGAAGSGNSGGAGGNGGGAIVLIVGGDLNFTGTIDVRGNTGTVGNPGGTGSNSGGGGGGGGSGGSFAGFYKTATSVAGTISVTAGSGAAGGAGNTTGGNGGAGGAGSNGESVLEPYYGLL